MIRRAAALLAATIFVACATSQPPAPARPSVPVSEAKPVVETLHGVTVPDPYRWLEDQQTPAARDWINRQNAYTDALLGKLPQKERFAKRIETLLANDQISTPLVRGG